MTTTMAPQELPGTKTSLRGPVEIAWYPDHLRITVRAVRPASTEAYASDDGRDVIVEIRPAGPEAPELVPGAD